MRRLLRMVLMSGAPPAPPPAVVSAAVSTDGLTVAVTWSVPTNEPTSTAGHSLSGTHAAITSITWSDSTTELLHLDWPIFDSQVPTITIAADTVEDLASQGNELTEDLVLTNASTATPFDLTIAHDGFDADTGVTEVSGKATAVTDRTGNGNTLTEVVASEGPTVVSGWRNGRKAFLGRSSASVVALRRIAHAQGALAPPFTRYFVGGYPAAANQYVGGSSTAAQYQMDATGTGGTKRAAMIGTSSELAVAVAPPATGTPVIWRSVFGVGSNQSSIRLEPHGAAVQSVTGTTGSTGSYSGILWLSYPSGASGNYVGYGAALLNLSGAVPTTYPALDAAIRAWFANYYNIVHA